MNYTEQTVFTQDFEANKGVLFFESGLTDFIQVGMPIQNDDEKIFVGKLAECEPGFCPDCSAKLVKNGTLVTTLKHVPLGIEHTKIKVSYARFRVSTPIVNSILEVSLFPLKPMVIELPRL